MKRNKLFATLAVILALYGAYSIGYTVMERKATSIQVRPAVAAEQPTNTADLLRISNEERAKVGDTPLAYNVQLEASANNKCADMVMRNYWSHNAPDGTEPWAF